MNLSNNVLKKLIHRDLLIFGVFCGVTMFLYGGYMTNERRQTARGRIEIIIMNSIFWGSGLFLLHLL